MAILRRMRALWHNQRLNRDIAAELQSHVEMRADANRAAGMTSADARKDAERRLGNDLALRERTRDVDTPRWLGDFVRDLGFAARGLRRNPGFAVVAMLTLALGIGATTAMFSVVNAVLINTLPYPDASRLVGVRMTGFARGKVIPATASPQQFEAIQQSGVFSHVAFFSEENVTLYHDGFADDPEIFRASPGLFAMLGITPALQHGLRWGARQIVLSDAYWRQRFHADPAVLGQSVRIDNQRYAVAGVLPPAREYPLGGEVWMLDTPRGSADRGDIIARLQPGAPIARALERAQAAMAVLASRPGMLPVGLPAARLTVGPLRRSLAPPAARRALLVLFAAVGFVLLVACANAASLLLARGGGRQREMAVRRALGASRWRLSRQLLTEALWLGGGGGALGWLLAAVAMSLVRLGPATIPRLQSARLDPRASGFALAVALLSGLACGLAPSLRFSQPGLQGGFQGGDAVTRSLAARGGFLLIGEVALTLVLLVGAALMLGSFDKMLKVNPGFNPRQVFTFDVIAPAESAAADEREGWLRRDAMDQAALARIRALPGVLGATDCGYVLPDDGYSGDIYQRIGATAGIVRAYSLTVGSDYFRTMEALLLRGRDFGPNDLVPPPTAFIFDRTKPPPPLPPQPVLINQAMARALSPGGDVLGQIFFGATASARYVVIGVVGNMRNASLALGEMPQVYQPMGGAFYDATFLVRSTLPPSALMSAVRGAISATDKSLSLGEPQTLEQAMAPSLDQPRFRSLLLSVFAALALVLALIGIYGALAYHVQQRRREIGVRMALGATRGMVMRMVLGESLRVLGAGIGVGCLLAWGLTRYVASLLFGVSALDAPTWIAAAVGLTLAGLLASYLPARRATQVDPVEALRCE